MMISLVATGRGGVGGGVELVGGVDGEGIFVSSGVDGGVVVVTIEDITSQSAAVFVSVVAFRLNVVFFSKLLLERQFSMVPFQAFAVVSLEKSFFSLVVGVVLVQQTASTKVSLWVRTSWSVVAVRLLMSLNFSLSPVLMTVLGIFFIFSSMEVIS